MKMKQMMTKTSSKLTTHISILESNGYKHPPHYIGLTNYSFLYCSNCKEYKNHELMVKTSNEYRYVCEKCKCCVEYVD